LKRKLKTLIILPLSLFLMSTPAVAAIKAGASCNSQGQVKTSSGFKYTCIKSGKKLVWSKGVKIAVKVATPTATPTPRPTPSPTATPTPIVTYPEGPTGFDDLVENYKGISYAAWSKSSSQIKSSSAVSPALKILTGPNTKLIFEKPAAIFDLIARLYPGYGPATDLTVLSFGYDDREWAQTQLKILKPNDPTNGWVLEVGCVTRQTCWGGSVYTDQKVSQVLIATTEVLDENHTSGMLLAHEYTHAVQQNQMRFPQPWLNDTYPPVWLHEGGAQFSQNVAINYQSFEKYSSHRRGVSSIIFNDSKIDSQWIQEYLRGGTDLTWVRKYDRWIMYVMGAMFVEALVAIKGPEPTMEVWKLTGNGLKFPQAFEKVYGISFEKALPIISKAIALELGRG
jgi:hypothetical protein